MTIQEAIKSGKPFKRPRFETYLINSDMWFYENAGGEYGYEYEITVQDILAEDWEVKE